MSNLGAYNEFFVFKNLIQSLLYSAFFKFIMTKISLFAFANSPINSKSQILVFTTVIIESPQRSAASYAFWIICVVFGLLRIFDKFYILFKQFLISDCTFSTCLYQFVKNSRV